MQILYIFSEWHDVLMRFDWLARFHLQMLSMFATYATADNIARWSILEDPCGIFAFSLECLVRQPEIDKSDYVGLQLDVSFAPQWDASCVS